MVFHSRFSHLDSTRWRIVEQSGQSYLLRNGLKGLEKESLRLSSDGLLAHTPHPKRLGSALTHNWITTDYSEALLELITPPFTHSLDTLCFLEELHAFVYHHLGDEYLLATSMPVGLSGEESIPIAQYGSSNIARMKHVYRQGLARRYGRAMQSIAGVHFNYSVNQALWPVLHELEKRGDQPLSEFINEAYFGLIRNIHRYGWLIIYLFGCSPSLCASFFTKNPPTGFIQWDSNTFYRPYATSLRMSDIGYRNSQQANLDVSFNTLTQYVESLTKAIVTRYPPYEKIGVKVGETYRQLNTCLLQIENEYYSAIRPKQITYSGEKPSLALKKRGVHYVELRLLDLLATAPSGVELEQLHFLELFLLFCLLVDSPFLSREEMIETNKNNLIVACCGRTPDFHLFRHGKKIRLTEWLCELLAKMEPIAETLDIGERENPYTYSLRIQKEVASQVEATPSAKMLSSMQSDHHSFSSYAIYLSHCHALHWQKYALSPEKMNLFTQEARISWDKQYKIEQSDTLSFDEFLEHYFSQT